MVYFGCDKGKYEKSLNLVYKEFEKLRKTILGSLQLSKAKKQILGQVAIMSENNEALMLSMGKTMLMFNRIDTLDDIKKKIEAVTAKQIIDTANDILNPDKLSVLTYI